MRITCEKINQKANVTGIMIMSLAILASQRRNFAESLGVEGEIYEHFKHIENRLLLV
jgi:hypothetical protein